MMNPDVPAEPSPEAGSLDAMPSLRKRTPLVDLMGRDFGESYVDRDVLVAGWIRTIRVQGGGGLAFVEVSDGTTSQSLQVICERKRNPEEFQNLVEESHTGASVCLYGRIVPSIGSRQKVEMQARRMQVLGPADQQTYPLTKKKHTLEYLREFVTLRARSRTFSAVARIRNALMYSTHQFFQSRNFICCQSPVLTSIDCEGAGEMFQVTTLLPNARNCAASGDSAPQPPTPPQLDYQADFFKRPVYLTVSGQLSLECYACSLSNVYSFGPTFRAEKSKTTRHLAEFWMLEPEIAFADLDENIAVATDYIKYVFQYVLQHCQADLEFMEKLEQDRLKEAAKGASSQQRKQTAWNQGRALRERLQHNVDSEFARVTYTQAINLLFEADVKFEEPVHWGIDIPSEMERYLCEVVFKRPVVITDYPKDIKAFYMRLNDDQKTVAAMDILVPGIGELIGGSQREERVQHLRQRLLDAQLDPNTYAWYLDLRKYGTVPHSGFGLGFERLVRYVTALENIKDVCMFPRAWGMPIDG
ncbi:asparagine--tRNA ligase-like [Schistocerca gregaria]|uniref:asparagine--tRNA ligase-like n=1 Tax=Schistocerca gregaria TaxID=7010 RepID=UPI00211E1011|nr:asparagine--tRNA ligase-like [Schistocerca gregaria]